MATQDDARGPAGAAEAVAERLADWLAQLGGPVRQQVADRLRELGAVDRAIYGAVASTPTPSPAAPPPPPQIPPASGWPWRPGSRWRAAGPADARRCAERWPSASPPR